MTQLFQPVVGFRFITPAGGDEYLVSLYGRARTRNEGKTIFLSDDLFYSCAGEDPYAVSFTGGQEAVDDGLRVISDGKDPSICFRFKLDASLFKPTNGIYGTKLGKGLSQFFVAARIVFDQFVGFFAGVGDIASATAGNFYFGQELGRLF